MFHLFHTNKCHNYTLHEFNSIDEKYNYVKSKTKKKYIKLIKNKELINQIDNIDNLCQLINIIGFSKSISTPNIYRCQSYYINKIINQSQNKIIAIKKIIISLYKSGLVYVFCLQIFCPLFILIDSFNNIFNYEFNSGSGIQKMSAFLLAQCFLFSIDIEIIKEYRETYIFLHSNHCNKTIILIGMFSNLICALLSIICMPIIVITSDSLIDLVFNTMAILFLNELDEALIEEKNCIEYNNFLIKYKIDIIDKFDSSNIFERYLYKFNYFLYLCTLFFSKLSILILPIIIIFLI